MRLIKPAWQTKLSNWAFRRGYYSSYALTEVTFNVLIELKVMIKSLLRRGQITPNLILQLISFTYFLAARGVGAAPDIRVASFPAHCMF